MNTSETHSKNGQTDTTQTTLNGVSTGSETSSNSPATRWDQASEAEKASAVANLLSGQNKSSDTGVKHDGRIDAQSSSEDHRSGTDGTGDAEPVSHHADDRGANSDTETGTEGSGAGDLQSDTAADQQATAPPKTLTEAAEQLGIEAKDLYKLTITTGDGETVTLGDLKDTHQNRQAAERESAERAAALDQRETALVAEQRLWGELGESLASALTPDKRQALKAHLDERDARERQRMVQAMPEMADPNAFGQFRDDAIQLLGNYGFKPHEVVVGDHRQLLVLRDLMRAQKRLKDLQNYKPKAEPPKSQKVQGRAKTPSKRQQIVQRATQSRHEADKVAGVAALLNGD